MSMVSGHSSPEMSCESLSRQEEKCSTADELLSEGRSRTQIQHKFDIQRTVLICRMDLFEIFSNPPRLYHKCGQLSIKFDAWLIRNFCGVGAGVWYGAGYMRCSGEAGERGVACGQ